MTRPDPKPDRADVEAAKREPGAYITRAGNLYEVLRWDEKDRWLITVNSLTLAEFRMTGAQAAQAELVRPAPVAPDHPELAA
jgi:hypothetical protein